MEKLLTTKRTLIDERNERMAAGTLMLNKTVGIIRPTISGHIDRANDKSMWNRAMRASRHSRSAGVRLTGKYGSAYDVPRKWSDGATMSVRERIQSGKLSLPDSPQASTNTLIADWQRLWDAMRLDLTVRKEAMPTVREFLYQVYSRPNASRIANVSEILPAGIVFEEVDGQGESAPMGETIGGNYDIVTHRIFAAAFSWTLLAELFDEAMDNESIGDAVGVGYNAMRDDRAISPIVNYAYGPATRPAVGTTKHTPPYAPSAGFTPNRQEHLYLTLQDALDDLAKRRDPTTGRKISLTGAVVISSEESARHITDVAEGLPSNNERRYSALTAITRVIGYDGETIQLRDRNVTYPGILDTEAYIVIPNRKMLISIKRDLQVEVDLMPNVKTLSREERCWWFCEGIFHGGDQGVGAYVQKVTLPSW